MRRVCELDQNLVKRLCHLLFAGGSRFAFSQVGNVIRGEVLSELELVVWVLGRDRRALEAALSLVETRPNNISGLVESYRILWRKHEDMLASTYLRRERRERPHLGWLDEILRQIATSDLRDDFTNELFSPERRAQPVSW